MFKARKGSRRNIMAGKITVETIDVIQGAKYSAFRGEDIISTYTKSIRLRKGIGIPRAYWVGAVQTIDQPDIARCSHKVVITERGERIEILDDDALTENEKIESIRLLKELVDSKKRRKNKVKNTVARINEILENIKNMNEEAYGSS